jgi:uncharacterized surface protein with fasciclin (FAS1) repeats
LISSFVPASNNNSPNAIVEGMTLEDIFEWQAYHFVLDSVEYSSDLTDGLKLRTLQGNDVTFSVVNGTTYVNAAKILKPDYFLTQGVMHVIDM